MCPDSLLPAMDTDTARLYATLEDRVMARDQKGASDTYYDLVRAGRPLSELLSEAVRIHGPYTHVPYHERIDDGFVNFVNNDHCLLSARATIHLSQWLPPEAQALPMAQTIWYMPTGLDIWNQKILKAPGHYARGGGELPAGPPPAPVRHWPDQEPKALSGPLEDRLNEWATQVHRGNVLEAYSIFLGVMQNPADRQQALAQLVFAGLSDVQDRVLYNRSYTTGHKAFRARATVELGNLIGWDQAHDVLYAGALDIGVGPRWYSTYEMACNLITVFIDGDRISAIPYSGTSEREREVLTQSAPLTQAEGEALIHVLLREPEPAYIEHLANLLKAGKGPRQILDVIQLAAAQVLLETRDPNGFSIPQHCYEYMNTLGWFYDNFQHPQRLKLLFVAASYLNRNATHQRALGDVEPAPAKAPSAAAGLSPNAILDHAEEALVTIEPEAALAWTRAYLDTKEDRAPLVQRISLAACRIGNDPHNQELAQCLLEDYGKNKSWDRDRLIMAAAQHTVQHRKYGDHLECSHRFGQAMAVERLQ